MHATIFYLEKEWLTGKAECYSLRMEAQKLPKDAIPVGFIADDGESISFPANTPEQEKDFKDTLAAARQAVAEIGGGTDCKTTVGV